MCFYTTFSSALPRPADMGRDSWNSGFAQTGIKVGTSLKGMSHTTAQLIYRAWTSSGQHNTIANVTFTDQATLQKPWAGKETYLMACINLPPSSHGTDQTFISQFTGNARGISGVMQFYSDNCTIPSLTGGIFNSDRASINFCFDRDGNWSSYSSRL